MWRRGAIKGKIARIDNRIDALKRQKAAAQTEFGRPATIVNPLRAARGESSSLFSTHPPTTERVKILRSMSI